MGLFVCQLQAAGYPHWAYFSYLTYYAIGEQVHRSMDEPSSIFGSQSLLRKIVYIPYKPL